MSSPNPDDLMALLTAYEAHPTIITNVAKFIVATHAHVTKKKIDAGFAIGVTDIDLGELPSLFLGAFRFKDEGKTLDVTIERLIKLRDKRKAKAIAEVEN